jgi:hypothetical protein
MRQLRHFCAIEPGQRFGAWISRSIWSSTPIQRNCGIPAAEIHRSRQIDIDIKINR